MTIAVTPRAARCNGVKGITYGEGLNVHDSWLRVNDLWLGRQYVARKAFSMFWRIGDLINHARIFPLDSLQCLESGSVLLESKDGKYKPLR